MKKFKFALMLLFLTLNLNNFAHAMEKTPPETQKQNNLENTDLKTLLNSKYEAWCKDKNNRTNFEEFVKNFEKKLENLDYYKTGAIKLHSYINMIQRIFLDIVDFFNTDYILEFGKTIKKIYDSPYAINNEKYENFKKEYDKYTQLYLNSCEKFLKIYDKMKNTVYEFLENNFGSQSNSETTLKQLIFDAIIGFSIWEKILKNYLFPIYNFEKRTESNIVRYKVYKSIPLHTFSLVAFLRDNSINNTKILPLSALKALKTTLEIELKINHFYNMFAKLENKEINKKYWQKYLVFIKKIKDSISIVDNLIISNTINDSTENINNLIKNFSQNFSI